MQARKPESPHLPVEMTAIQIGMFGRPALRLWLRTGCSAPSFGHEVMDDRPGWDAMTNYGREDQDFGEQIGRRDVPARDAFAQRQRRVCAVQRLCRQEMVQEKASNWSISPPESASASPELVISNRFTGDRKPATAQKYFLEIESFRPLLPRSGFS